jgi:hypothetical protein
VSNSVGHVQGFLKVFLPREIHWSKGKATMEKGFENKRFKGRPFLINLRRLEYPWGKGLMGRWVLGRWRYEMSIKKRTSRVEGEHRSIGVSWQARSEGFEM